MKKHVESMKSESSRQFNPSKLSMMSSMHNSIQRISPLAASGSFHPNSNESFVKITEQEEETGHLQTSIMPTK
jgi:hypothetical protein